MTLYSNVLLIAQNNNIMIQLTMFAAIALQNIITAFNVIIALV